MRIARQGQRNRGDWVALLLSTSLAAWGCSDDEPESPSGDAGSVPDLGAEPDGGSSSGLRIEVGSLFPAGTAVRDAYSGAEAVVAVDGTVRFEPGPRGVVLVERASDASARPAFAWDNVTVYFAMIDRFQNGDTTNDTPYGRDFTGMPTVGTFHGGDLKGLTDRLDHIERLGATALWITAPFEQIHGYVAGPGGRFPHFGYAGYWALDFTRLDASFGTEDELRTLVDAAHARGIRVVVDVVMNHPGYATLPEIAAYFPEALRRTDWQSWRPGPNQSWSSFNDLFIDYTSPSWANWWGPAWIRAGLPGYLPGGSDDRTRSLASLPDFRTEDFRPVAGLPPMLTRKSDTRAVVRDGFTVRQYLVDWLTRWVREYGIDGFRCDTAKHVELAAWADLKQAGLAALAEWKAANPAKKLDDLPFWTTAEVFPHGVVKDEYFTMARFDSVINFDFKSVAAQASRDPTRLESIYSTYAAALNPDPEFDVLTYISSHDTSLFFETTRRDIDLQYRVGTALLLTPGGVQIFYGDETARPAGPDGGDAPSGTRSDMNWATMDTGLLEHWQKLGQFRRRHPAIGAGEHRLISNDGSAYVFSRRLERAGVTDGVVVAIAAPPS